MSIVTMAQADLIMNAVIARGAELNCRPISVIVVEPGCKVKGFKKEDGASMIRFEMAYGKAYAALSLGPARSSCASARSSGRSSCAISSLRATSRSFPKAAAC